MRFRSNYASGIDADGIEMPVKRYEINEGESMTVPDQAMSIQEMLRRAASGLPLDGGKVPMYEGDEDTEDDDLIGHPDLSKMDLVDRAEYIEQQKLNLAAIKERIRIANAMQKEADKGTEVQRTTGEKGEESTEGAPVSNNPKKTRGAGAEPRNTGKSSESKEEAAG